MCDGTDTLVELHKKCSYHRTYVGRSLHGSENFELGMKIVIG